MKLIKTLKNLLRKGREKKKQFWYARYYKHAKIQEKTVLYQAYRNNIMGGNPYGIFSRLMEDPDYKDYTHVWVYKQDQSLEDDTFQKYSGCPNVVYVKNGARKYYKYLASCQFLISNAAFPAYWVKKEGQTYINTWHGTPLKTLGRQAKDRSLSSIMNAQRNFFQCDYMVMPNRYTIERMAEAYDLKGMFTGTVIDAGYPRTDLAVNTDKSHILELLERKLKKSLSGRKIVLYAPTFRSEGGRSVNTSEEVGQYMTDMMDVLPPDYELVFKVHNMMASFFKNNSRMEGRLIFDEIETNELLSVTDVLITDYSSIFFDFLCRKKPILFFVYDRQEYADGRGLYRPLEELPGAVCETVGEIKEQFGKIQDGSYDCREKFQRYLEEFAYNDDGMASKRAVDIIFGKKPGMERYIYQMSPAKERTLVLGGSLAAAENKWECIRTLKSLDCGENTVALLSHNVFSFTEEWEKISGEIRLMASSPALLMTFFEYVCYKLFHRVFTGTEFWERQYKKFFGGVYFSKVLDIGRNNSLWEKTLKGRCGQYVSVPRPQGVDQLECLRMEAGHEMTVLFLAGFDSVNYVYVNIIRELQKRGCRIMLLALDKEDVANNKMFTAARIPFTDIKEFDMDLLAEVDLAFLSPIQNAAAKSLYRRIDRHRIFCISFANLFSSVTMHVYTDLIFAIGVSKFQEFEENGLHYSMVAAGNPQYDDLIEIRKGRTDRRIDSIRRVLFIDQGGYPFGEEGKRLLGQTLLAMAQKHPKLEFTVKPRYLPQELSYTVLHAPSEHIYDFIPHPPENLILLREPTILEDLLKDFDAVVTMWSTAYLDAALMGIPVLLIRGLPSQEIFNVRNQRVEEAFDRLEKTGCVTDYREVLQGKLEFHFVDEAYLKEEVANVDRPCAPEIADALEEIYHWLIVPGRRLKDVCQTDMQTFREQLPTLPTISARENIYRRRRNFLRFFNEKIQSVTFHNRCMAKPFQLQALQKYWYFCPDKNFGKNRERLLKFWAYFSMWKIERNFFRPRRMARETDPIRLDYYMGWLYKNRRHRKILAFDNPCMRPETKAFYHAAVYLRRGDYDRAAKEYAAYYHCIKELDAKPLHRDRNVVMSVFPKGMKCAKYMETLYGMKEYDLLKEMGKNNRFDIYLRTYYLLKALADEGQTDEMRRQRQEFLDSVKKPKAGEKLNYYLACVQMGADTVE